MFTATDHCRARVHCGRCRDLEGGRAWRAKMAARFGGPVDWPCPADRPWGFRPRADDVGREVAAVRAGIVLARRRAEACAVCGEPVCPVREFFERLSPCQRRARLRRPGYACPFGRWPPPDAAADIPGRDGAGR